MLIGAARVVCILAALAGSCASAHLSEDAEESDAMRYSAADEYLRHLNSMIEVYRGRLGGRLVMETNALGETESRAWKRNADLINSLLALPKGMNDAGR